MGKKSGPVAPTPPDPVATVNAQATANKDAAVSQANLNRIDQYTPQGSLQYIQVGKNEDGTPQYAAYQSYSPAESAKYNSQNNVEMSLDNLAQSNVARVGAAQATPFSFDGMTPNTDRVGYNLPGIQSSVDLPDMRRSVDTGPIVDSYGSGGPIQGNFAAPSQPLNYSAAGAGDVTRNVGDGPLQTRFDSGNQVSYLPNGAGGHIQGSIGFDGLPKVPEDFAAEGQRVGNAVYGQATSRLDPQFANQSNDLNAQMADQGIPVGSAAYTRAIDAYNRNKTDAYNQANFSAIQAAGAEQARLFGQALSARQQGVGEVQAAGNFTNAAQAQGYSQAYGTNQANNAAQGQQYGQNQTLAQFYNSAAGQQFAQRVQNANLNNTAQGQVFGQNSQNAQLNNAAWNQQVQFNQAQAQFGNQAQQQQNTQNQQAAAFHNVGQDQGYQQAVGLADLFNSTGQTMFGNQQAAAGFNNQARSQAFNEQLTNANLGNAARQQQIQESTYQRNLPLNEIAALLGTGPGVQNPSFTNVPQVGVAAPDYQGAVYNNYNGALQQYQAQQQARSQMLGSIFGAAGSLGAAAITHSDRRVKENIVPIAALPNGIPTYAFNYIGDALRRFGVMAQDVLHIMPDAVHDLNGVLAVDYKKVFA